MIFWKMDCLCFVDRGNRLNVFCRQCCIDLSCVDSVGTSVSDGVSGRGMDCEI